jgi:energy-coupling factor transport system permease protein
LQGGEDRLSPRLKISFYVVFIVSLFFIQGIYLHAFTAAAVFILVLVALPPGKIKSGLFPLSLFLLFTFAGNVFFHSGRIIYRSGFLSVTDEGLLMAGVRTLRVFSMIFAAKLLTAVLSIDEMVRSLESILRPLEKIGIPVRDFFSVIGLTLKFFPALMTYLLKEYREHMKSDEARDFRHRMRHMVSFLMPVFVKSIRSPESFFASDSDALNVKEDL